MTENNFISPLKAALLSALVLPGLGHLLLKKYITGYVVLISFSITLYFFIHDVYSKVEQVLNKIQRGEIPFDPQAIALALQNTHSDLSIQTLNIITYLLLAIWLFAVSDAYRVANKLRVKNTRT